MSAPTVREVAQPTPDAAEQARDLVASLVRTSAPRLGRTAVARIAGPLTEAVVALRAELLDSAQAWHQVGQALGAEDPTDPRSAMFAIIEIERNLARPALLSEDEIAELIRTHVSLDPTEYRQSTEDAARVIAVELAGGPEQPIEVGDVIDQGEAAKLARLPVGAVVRNGRRATWERLATGPRGWASTGGATADTPVLPVRVLDLGGDA